MFWHQINAYEDNGMCNYNIILALIMVAADAIFITSFFVVHNGVARTLKPLRTSKIKGRLLEQAVIFLNASLFIMGTSLKGNFGYCPRASFLRRETGKVVLVLSFDHFRIRINTGFRYVYVRWIFPQFLDKIK